MYPSALSQPRCFGLLVIIFVLTCRSSGLPLVVLIRSYGLGWMVYSFIPTKFHPHCTSSLDIVFPVGDDLALDRSWKWVHIHCLISNYFCYLITFSVFQSACSWLFCWILGANCILRVSGVVKAHASVEWFGSPSWGVILVDVDLGLGFAPYSCNPETLEQADPLLHLALLSNFAVAMHPLVEWCG